MTTTVRRMTICFLFCVAGSCWASSVTFGDGSVQSSSAPLSSEGGLVVPGVQSLDEGQQVQAQEQASLTNPEAVAEREASTTKFKGLDTEQAAKVASEDFPEVVDRPEGPPPLAAGVKSLGFTGASVEQVQTGSGDVGVVQSTVPMAVASGGAHWAAVNLALREAGGGFEAQNPLLQVRLPKHLAEGAQVGGISLTPVDDRGVPLGGSEGVADGVSVFFGNTLTDADTVLKPVLAGVEASAVLRSVDSPEVLYYRVGLPQGASLVASSGGLGAEVLDEGVAIARIKPPTATDAAGTLVPVSMSVSGDTLVVSVRHGVGSSYRYPILVDPELSGYWQEWSNVVPGNWEFHEWSGYTYEIAGAELRMKHEPGSFQANDYAIWAERTKGYTKIFDVYVKDELYPWSSPGWLKSYIEIYKAGGGTEGVLEMSGSSYRSEGTVCGAAGCAAAGADSEGNVFAFELTTREAGSTGEQFYVHAGQVSTGIAQEYGKHSTVSYNTSSSEIEGTPNVLAGSGGWMGPYSGKVEYFSEDGGLGVTESWAEVYGSGGWGKIQETNFQLKSPSCAGIQCAANEREVASYKSLTDERTKPLAEPEAHIRVSARSAMPYSSSNEHGEGETIVKVDAKAPHGIVLTGLGSKGAEGKELELGEVESHFKVEATDGESVASSGIKKIGVEIDGQEIPSERGLLGSVCTPGPCTASNEWSINGAELGVGVHVLTVAAEDYVGNVAPKEYELKVYHASPVAMGPGSVNPESGDFALEASDVSLGGGMGSLQVTRHYDSRNPKEDEEGPLGPQWTIGLGSLASLEVLPDSSVMVIGPDGLTHFSVKTGGGFEAPEGDKNLTLESVRNSTGITAYIFKDPAQGTTTEFAQPKGAKMWMPTISKGPAATDTTTDEYTTVTEGSKTIVEPTVELAPHASATCAKEKMEAGCRSLEFKYGKETTAKGEAKSEWGEYKNRLKEVLAVAYNPSSKKMVTTPVAQYEYDLPGRLRAEWDPRISPALKTFYGYDAEGHVTALTPPGQESWAFTYGAIQGDSTPGRLLKAMRAPASTPVWKGEASKNTTAPKLSGSAVVGVKMGVSTGSWSNEPVTYAYQWSDCNILGGSCTPIIGATNANYTLTSNDSGHTVVGSVSAINGAGSVVANTSASALVVSFGEKSDGEHHAPQAGSTIEYNVPLSGTGLPTMTKSEVEKWGQKDDPENAAAIFPPDEPQSWPASDYKRATIFYMDGAARQVNTASPSGGVTTTEYNENNDAVRTLSADNRAAALKEGSKSAETAKKLDTESKYNGEVEKGVAEPGTRLMERVGPEHKVKLAGGTEVSARARTKYSYDEGAPSGETFDLVTKTQVGAAYEGKETDIRETRTSYSGQKGLGWKLRKPTSVTTDPAGLDLTKTTVYEESNGNVVETKAPGGDSVQVSPPSYGKAFGSSGSGNGQFSHPQAVAIDASGNVWVADTSNNRIEKFSSAGAFIAAYGSKGSGEVQFSSPWGIAVNQTTGNVYVGDTGNNRIEELSSSGAFVEAIGWGVSDGKAELEVCKTGCKAGISGSGNGQFHEPSGLTIDSQGNVWVADEDNSRIEEFSSTGTYLSQFGSLGSGNGQLKEPSDVAISEGDLYVVDKLNNRVEEFSPTGVYLAQFGSFGAGHGQFSEPIAIVTNGTSGDLYVTDGNNSRVQEFSPAGKFLTEFGEWGAETAQFISPRGLAITPTGNLYIVDEYNERIQEWIPPGAGGTHQVYATLFGSAGSGNGQFAGPNGAAIDGHGNVWVSDSKNSRVQEFSSAGVFIAAYGSHGTGNGQLGAPTGLDANQSTGNVYIADCEDNRIEELSSIGGFIRTFGSAGTEPGKLKCPGAVKIDASGNAWVTDSGNNRIEEFSSTGTFIAAYGASGSGNGQFKEPWGITIDGGNIYVTDYGNDRVQELSTAGSYLGQFGLHGDGGGQFEGPEGIAADPAGNLYVVDNGDSRVEEFTSAGAFLMSFGSEGASSGTGEGKLKYPEGIAINAAGDVYVVDAGNNRIEEWTPSNQAVHNTQTIYYTPKTEATVAACQNHPEWAGLPCQTQPAGQPETSGLTNLPVTDITYNMWEQAEAITETFGSTVRTRKNTFDGAGRPLTSEVTSTVDKAVPKVTVGYNEKTGALETESTTTEGKTKTITRTTNALGQLSSYTDADGATTTRKYDVDERLEEVCDSKGCQILAYDTTTGFLTKLLDSAAGMFTASYDIEGKMLVEGYPNGMNADYAISPIGQTIQVEYIKTTHCTSSCVWFSDVIVPSIHGEILAQTSTLSSEIYEDDNSGRLLKTQETPAGKGCVTRLYGWDEESNRRSLTTRQPGPKGECATEGGIAERHEYDPANRIIDSGVSYEGLGNITKLPAADAGTGEASHELTSSFYVDSQVASQTQNGETINSSYDPAGRTRETISSGKTASIVISHYDGPGTALSWTSESTEKWTRNIPGIGGEITAIQTNAGTPVLQLHDLNGNIIATAALSETETKLLTTYNSTEFGVPTTSNPPKYSWLGADGIASELPSGDITQDGNTYIPLTGQPLQTEPIELPLPLKYYNAYERPDGEAGNIVPAVLAQRNAESIAAEHATGGAGPLLEGSETLASGCTGTNACAASYNRCELKWALQEMKYGLMVAGGSISCTHSVHVMQIKVCILVENYENGHYDSVRCNGEKGATGYNANFGLSTVQTDCAVGLNYKSWTWGYASGGSLWFGGGGINSPAYRCEHDFTGEAVESVEAFL
jgi:YD repeat-containing protein